MKPREMISILMAYSESDKLDEQLLEQFESNFRQKFEYMNPEDISKFYYCMTKADRYGSGRLYKFLQKSLTKTIDKFDSGNLRHMFIDYTHEDNRLNKGIKGRIRDRMYFLMDRK